MHCRRSAGEEIVNSYVDDDIVPDIITYISPQDSLNVKNTSMCSRTTLDLCWAKLWITIVITAVQISHVAASSQHSLYITQTWCL